jgi:flagellar FliL protein
VASDDIDKTADDEAGADGEEVLVGDGTAATPRPRRKKLLIIGAAAALVLVGGGTGAALLMGGGEAETEVAAHDGGEDDVLNQPVDVPPLLVNLRSPDNAPHFLKVHVLLVPGPKSSAEALKNKVPVLLDVYQPFLRELRPEDLAGSAAVFRIKEQLLVRARETLGDGHVKDVLVQDLIQQ